jgi:hypothetical protein
MHHKTSALRIKFHVARFSIRMTWTALPITSAGRFSPLGPVGTFHLTELV